MCGQNLYLAKQLEPQFALHTMGSGDRSEDDPALAAVA